VLENELRAQFDDAAVAHLRAHFPAEFEAHGEESIRALIPKAIKRASIYSISAERDLLSWLGLMLVLGEDFDAYPENAWMKEILNNRVIDPDSRVDALFEELSQRDSEPQPS
jgi:hypothetical protein